MALVCIFVSTMWLIWAAIQVCGKGDDQHSQCYTVTAYMLVSCINQWKPHTLSGSECLPFALFCDW